MSHPMFEKHQEVLQSALAAVRERNGWSAYPEVPSGKIYGESAKDDGWAAFQKRLNSTFHLDQPGSAGTVGSESSPYGLPLNIKYPKPDLDALLPAAERAMPAWVEATPQGRSGVCLEILHRLNRRSFELASAVMHTTGQGFMMAFQAGGPHAQDRALEAVACAYREMSHCPQRVPWRKQVSKTDVVTLEKTFRIVPRGVAVVVGCSTFPTWNSYPALFASLVTGNAVVVKPHPGAVLPLAITVEIARQTLVEAGFDPNVVTLAADSHEAPITRDLVTRPQVRIVDYTGGSEFGEWLEANARQAVVFTEKAGVNSVIIDGVADLKAAADNLAFSISLYSGQMCTAPQNIFVPAGGIDAGGQHRSFDDVAQTLVEAINGLLGSPQRAAEILGCIQNPRTLERIDRVAGGGGQVLRRAQPVAMESFPQARTRSPLVMQYGVDDRASYLQELFGPICCVVATRDTAQSLEVATRSARELGAITCSIYALDANLLDRAEHDLTAAGAAVSCNLTGQVFVNQAAAFSDFHVSGVNPAGNATLCDAAFVANRFRIVQSRRPVA